MAKKVDAAEIERVAIKQQTITFHVLGRTPLVYNAMSAKSKEALLFPARKKTSAEKATSLKHNPIVEFRNSTYRRKQDQEGPTRLLAPATWFKAAMADAATKIEGATKSGIKQLTYVEGDYIDLYGVPQLLMSVVRSADMNRTPDVRTRAIVPQWYCQVRVSFITPQLSASAVAQLFAGAGLINAVGDWRVQKGGAYGQFEIVEANDERVKSLLKHGGMKFQDAALAEPICYDQETESLLEFFNEELNRRGFSTDGVYNGPEEADDNEPSEDESEAA